MRIRVPTVSTSSPKTVMRPFASATASCGSCLGLGDHLMSSIADVSIFCNSCLRCEAIVNQVIDP